MRFAAGKVTCNFEPFELFLLFYFLFFQIFQQLRRQLAELKVGGDHWIVAAARIILAILEFVPFTVLKDKSLGAQWTSWFQRFVIFTPISGEMIQFDLRIFLKWVGSTTNQWKYHKGFEAKCPIE